MRTTLHTGGPEHEGDPDVARRATQHADYHPIQVNTRAATPFDENYGRPRKTRSMREFQEKLADVPDDANARKHALVKPSERAASTAQQASGRLDSKIKRLEPSARSDEAARPYRDQAEGQHHGRETLGEQHNPMKLRGGDKERARILAPQRAESRERSPSRRPRPRALSSSPARKAKVWCGNNKLDKKLKANGGHLEIGTPSACHARGVGGGIHQEIPPGEEDAFIEKWIQPYEKLVDQPICYKDNGPVPHGMIRCTLPQALARGFAVGSIQRAKQLLKQRSHTAHGA